MRLFDFIFIRKIISRFEYEFGSFHDPQTSALRYACCPAACVGLHLGGWLLRQHRPQRTLGWIGVRPAIWTDNNYILRRNEQEDRWSSMIHHLTYPFMVWSSRWKWQLWGYFDLLWSLKWEVKQVVAGQTHWQQWDQSAKKESLWARWWRSDTHQAWDDSRLMGMPQQSGIFLSTTMLHSMRMLLGPRNRPRYTVCRCLQTQI